jgi:hypothetical protein
MNNFTDIELSIKTILDSISKKLEKTSDWPTQRELTTRIIDKIGKLGLRKGYQISPNYRNKYWTGWLYDLIWFEYSKEGYLINIPLVLECEWSGLYAEIIDDFSKLWVARAQHRIMIFNKKSDNDIYEMINKLQLGIGKFKESQSSDRYLFAGLNWNTGRFLYHIYDQTRKMIPFNQEEP